MNEIKTRITEQLRQLQMLMHRVSFNSLFTGGRKYDAHRGQGRVLSILRMKPEISQKELTYLLGMSKQSLAELLSKLEKSGYITRVPSDEDKRVVTIRLTEEGRNAPTDDGESEVHGIARVLDCLSDAELAAFSGYLGRIIERYEEQFPGDDYEERRKQREQFMADFGDDGIHVYGRGRGSKGFEVHLGGAHGFDMRGFGHGGYRSDREDDEENE
ncbi:MAG: MarR family transcriptional regulator [Oscillospiraceae bacterium]|nr:MarR family transcriptional regulator [Oscillospiraceae bacterium]